MKRFTARQVEDDRQSYVRMLGREGAQPALVAIESRYGLYGHSPDEVATGLENLIKRIRYLESNPSGSPCCVGCGRAPAAIAEYATAARQADMDPDQYVAMQEGTFNVENGHFACTACYIDMGAPTSPAGWVAP